MRREKYYGRRPYPGGGANFGGLDQFGRPIKFTRGGNLGGAGSPQGKVGGTDDPGRGGNVSTSTRPILDVSDSITGPRPAPPAGPRDPKPFFVPNGGTQNASTTTATPTATATPEAPTATATPAATEAPSTESTLPMKTGLAGANFGLEPTQVKEMTRGRGYGMTYMPQQRDPKEITYGGGGTGGNVINFAPIMTQQANPIMAVGGFGGRMAGGLPDLPIDTGTIFDPGTIGGGAVTGGGATVDTGAADTTQETTARGLANRLPRRLNQYDVQRIKKGKYDRKAGKGLVASILGLATGEDLGFKDITGKQIRGYMKGADVSKIKDRDDLNQLMYYTRQYQRNLAKGKDPEETKSLYDMLEKRAKQQGITLNERKLDRALDRANLAGFDTRSDVGKVLTALTNRGGGGKKSGGRKGGGKAASSSVQQVAANLLNAAKATGGRGTGKKGGGKKGGGRKGGGRKGGGRKGGRK